MTRPVNLFEPEASHRDYILQDTPNDQLAHVQDHIKKACSDGELAKEHGKMTSDRNYRPLSREEWEKDHKEKYGFHDFMMAHFSSDSLDK